MMRLSSTEQINQADELKTTYMLQADHHFCCLDPETEQPKHIVSIVAMNIHADSSAFTSTQCPAPIQLDENSCRGPGLLDENSCRRNFDARFHEESGPDHASNFGSACDIATDK